MNYKLSVGVDRPNGKSCFVVENSGTEVSSKVMSEKSDNIKKEVLRVLALGLRSCRGIVQHEDSLIIDIQNRHLHEWLVEGKDYKGYEAELDEVYQTLDTVNCRYRFVFNPKPYAKVFLSRNSKSAIKGSSIADF